ncbi:MAG: hypothetical protein ACTFAK_15050 [Candidatus Electronema sp. VV]
MNKNQKIVLISTVAIATLMLLFPPFQSVYETGTFNAGYGFLLAPPENGYAIVNLVLLLMQWVIVALIGGITFYFLKEE